MQLLCHPALGALAAEVAGATAVQLYSAMIYQGPRLVGRIVAELDQLAARDGLIDTDAWRVNLRDYHPVARFGASFYTRTNERFSLSDGPGRQAPTSTGIDEM